MLTKNDVFDFMKALNIKHNDSVLVHTSLKQIGDIEGGAEGLLSIFCEYLCDGLFIVPTFTYDNVNRQHPIFDVRNTSTCIGVLPQIAAKVALDNENAARSLHPTHSVAAFGKNAKEFVKGDGTASSPAQVGGVYSRLNDIKAKILLIGVGMERNTYLHALDEELKIPNRIDDNSYPITIIDKDGVSSVIPAYSGHCGHCWDFYPNYEKPLLNLGAVHSAKLGNADVLCCELPFMHDAIVKMWSKADYDLCCDNREIPKNYYNG